MINSLGNLVKFMPLMTLKKTYLLRLGAVLLQVQERDKRG